MRYIALLLLCTPVLFAQAAKGDRAFVEAARKAPPDAWTALFNGKDLTGWVPVGEEKWTVENGAIHGQGVTKKYGYLRTGKKYVDFEMSVRFKCLERGNSGVFFHTDFKPGTADVSQGLQFEVSCELRWDQPTGGIYGDGRNWIVWPPFELQRVVRLTDWNDYIVKVDGRRYTAWLNGVKLVDFTDPNPRSFDGYIALQLHSGGEGNMLFKDLYLRDLSKR
ncbi:MAG: DUF1080 domain-containing protein [Acidobacteria bacterium]|nr:DUF1080 domain-containing protein [Acidobacteriota bacterium]